MMTFRPAVVAMNLLLELYELVKPVVNSVCLLLIGLQTLLEPDMLLMRYAIVTIYKYHHWLFAVMCHCYIIS